MGLSEVSLHRNVKDLAWSLAAALHDKRLESEGVAVDFYYDSDIVFRLIRGFQAVYSTFRKPRSQELLVGSLLSAGYLGRVNLLRPHALELDSNIRSWGSSFKKEAGHFTTNLARFIEDKGVADSFSTLATHLPEAEDDPEIDIKLFFEQLRSCAEGDFVWLELASGTWEQRLKRLMLGRETLIDSKFVGFSMVELRAASSFRYIRGLLSEFASPRRSDLSDLRDAAALATLERLVADFDGDRVGDQRQVRFYTETPTLRTLWSQNEKLRTLLSYKNISGEPRTSRAVWRESSYFLLRALFGPLHFPGVKRSTLSAQAVTLDELSAVSSELMELAGLSETDEGELQKRVELIAIGDRSVQDLLSDIEDLSFVAEIWSNLEAPSNVEVMLKDFSRVMKFSRSRKVVQWLSSELSKDVDSLRSALREGVGDVQAWLKSYRSIFRAAVALEDEDRLANVPDPLRDLGLVRWGCDSAGADIDAITSFWERLFSDDERTIAEASADLADGIESADDAQDCLTCGAVLWFLGLFGEVALCIDQWEARRRQPLPVYLEVMRMAARVRSGVALTGSERQVIEKALDRGVRHAEGRQDFARRSLGWAYICFYFWWWEHMDGVFAWEASAESEESRSWVIRSYELAFSAMGQLGGDDLAYAFAVNHCVYVGVLARHDPDSRLMLLNRLSQYFGGPQWNYRFADTLSYTNYIQAMRLFDRYRANWQNAPRSVNERLLGHLEEAERWNRKAHPAFGDSEIEEHSVQIKNLRRALEEAE